MAVVSYPISNRLAVILNNGQTESGQVRTKTVNVAAVKSDAGNTPCYVVAAAVKALYSETMVRIQKTMIVGLRSDS